MIIEYHRPKSLEAALKLIGRTKTPTYPMGGGTVLNRPTTDRFAVADLQALGLDRIRKSGNNLEIGATVTLQALQDSAHLPEMLKQILDREANYNLRQVATLAGSLISCDGRSPLATALLALDAKLSLIPDEEEIHLGNLLPRRSLTKHGCSLPGKLITKVTISLQPQLCWEAVSRTPADLPQVGLALVRWPSGRTRLALAGWGNSPLLAMDGNEPGGVMAAAQNSFAEAEDEWASAEYRCEMARVLAQRCQVTLERQGS
ncbi:MAG: FAD binding domain-containing protein [Anaerolineales bacterium]|jgi:CO/xanthine dehydrogenase FAD-binding subunit